MTTQKKDDICRLCLIIDDGKYLQLDDISKEALKTVIPELNLDVPAEFVVCSKCSQSIEDSFSIKMIISKNQDLIRREKEKLQINDKVDLYHIFKADANKSGSTEKICRFCLNKNEGNYTSLNNITTDVLETCLSELDKDLTANPAICELCYKGLQNMYRFKMECLSVEKKIKSYYDSVSDGEVDLHKVLNSSKDVDTDFLAGFEVQDEEEGDIFGSISLELDVTGTDRKQSTSETGVVELSKKQKLDDEISNVAEDGLPHYKFQLTSKYDPFKSETVGEWLAKVDEIKRKENWSDYITINKVLARMKNLNELCTWFSNISDIMNWEEWKKKVTNAFPLQDDYECALKRMFFRKKNGDETFVDYYNAKLQLLEPLNIVGEKAVTYILGGITDHVISSLGRVRQYKTPEELLIYLKSCDDDQPVNQYNANNIESEQPEVDSNEKTAKLQCTKCNKQGHNSQICTSKTPGTMNLAHRKAAGHQFMCRFCSKIGHKTSDCRIKLKLEKKLKLKESGSFGPAKRKRPSGAQQKKRRKEKMLAEAAQLAVTGVPVGTSA